MSNDKRKRARQQHRQRHAQEQAKAKKQVNREAREAKRSPGLTIDAIGLRAMERDDTGRITIADSGVFECLSTGNILVLSSDGQQSMVIGWGFIDAIADAVAERRKLNKPPPWWRRVWGAMRGPS